MTRSKQTIEPSEINVWPTSPPDDVGSPPEGELSVDSEDLGLRYLTDAVEQDRSIEPMSFGDEYDDLEFDIRAADGLLRSFGLEPPGGERRSGVRVVPPQVRQARSLMPSGVPDDMREHSGLHDEIDLTAEAIHEASLLDHEAEEAGEVESPRLCTEDTRTHGRPRGGHARASLRAIPGGRR